MLLYKNVSAHSVVNSYVNANWYVSGFNNAGARTPAVELDFALVGSISWKILAAIACKVGILPIRPCASCI